jgi:spore germination cell wall hydrolase CwlJ-like protein
VVYEGSTRSTGCQFTFTCDGSIRDNPRGPAWRQAQSIAAQVYGGLSMPLTGAATHYHTTAVDPYWNDSLVQTRRIGAHIFYRLPSKREKRAIEVEASLRGRYDAGETGVSGAAS